MARRERDILERSVHAGAKQATKANELIDDVLAAGFGKSDPVVVRAKLIRLELLQVKGDLERELGKLVLNCTACGQEVHWGQGISMADPGHSGHRFSAARRTGRVNPVEADC